MKLYLFLLASAVTFAAGWDSVQRIAPNEKIEVVASSGARTRATFVSATSEVMIVREPSGERSVARTDIRELRVYDSGRPVRKGVLWTLVGGGAGFGVGWLICVHCYSEGAGFKYMGPIAGVGAGIGALGFLSSPYKTVYKSN